MFRKSKSTFLSFAFLLSLATSLQANPSANYDVVIYGATASGAIAAISAAKQGAKVALLEPGRHIGGMVTGGLGHTDFLRQDHVIGGFSREFFERVGKHYNQPIAWNFEPSVAERILTDWVKSAGVTVLFNHRLASIEKKGTDIQTLQTENGATFTARFFIDASYEGDLMKAAGVSYSIGRESRSKYGEMLAGRQEVLPGHHQFRVPVENVSAENPLAKYITPLEQVVPVGEGDGKVQGYGFRLCLTDVEANRLPIEKPKNYDPKRYELVRLHAMALGEKAMLSDFMGLAKIPNGKTDINSNGGVSTNLMGAAWQYPDADYKLRDEIWNEHLEWAQGLFYFLGNDSSITYKIRKEISRYGLPKDEFVDTDHWPHQLYIRDGRRMTGEYVLTEHDLLSNRTKFDAIGMAGYNIDIREIQWVAARTYYFPRAFRHVFNEGYLSYPVEPYQIPYRSLLPRAGEASNLLVTACISASAVAYASFRMEPQYMIVGHAAGVAVAQAMKTGRTLHTIDLPALQAQLKKDKQILSLENSSPPNKK